MNVLEDIGTSVIQRLAYVGQLWAQFWSGLATLRVFFPSSASAALLGVHSPDGFEGFETRGGPDAVGRSTTTAVVRSTLLVILADVVFTTIFYISKF